MKFGKKYPPACMARSNVSSLERNEVPEWRLKSSLFISDCSSYYINYKGLKKEINSAAKKNPQSGLPPHGFNADAPDLTGSLQNLTYSNLTAFFFELDRNVELVNDFFVKKSGDLVRRFKLLLDRYGDSESNHLEDHELEDLVWSLESFAYRRLARSWT